MMIEEKDNTNSIADVMISEDGYPVKDGGTFEDEVFAPATLKGGKGDMFQGRQFKHAIGRRKSSRARIRMYPEGKGIIVVNGIDYKRYFPHFEFQKIITQPLDTVKQRSSFDISIIVEGGGLHGQAESIRLGLSRGLILFDQSLKATLKKALFLTRDPRVKERKKPGLKRARRAPQWQKR